ncbi:hypothetical protein NK718_13415 [Alsobacter sp. SYSU M60028]|uniref:CesD/SycD/LcrH family type III secretion system chaperone n=1 Tax=Alsobacter ponti TaxID=2962936 RepID=A0ABT1LDL3_9HYPH|nr:hypothetical protein [Alsobacter ponti]MCP8939519.1 hypothetical protein [Alsobacter ponti]
MSAGESSAEPSSPSELLGAAVVALGLGGEAALDRLRNGDGVGEALALPDAAVDLLYAGARRWLAVGRADKAGPLFRTLCFIAPRRAAHWLGLGICLRLDGAPGDAARCFGMAQILDPKACAPAFHLAELALRQGDGDAARSHLDSFFSLAAEDMRAEPAMVAEAQRYRGILGRAPLSRA